MHTFHKFLRYRIIKRSINTVQVYKNADVRPIITSSHQPNLIHPASDP
jgi:hypothetical protein